MDSVSNDESVGVEGCDQTCEEDTPESSCADQNIMSSGRVALKVVNEAGGDQFTNSVGKLDSVVRNLDNGEFYSFQAVNQIRKLSNRVGAW